MGDSLVNLTLDGRRLIKDLKVIELRAELEQRGLAKNGNKKDLVQRLSKFEVKRQKQKLVTGQPNQETPNQWLQNESNLDNDFLREYFESQKALFQEQIERRNQIGVSETPKEDPALIPIVKESTVNNEIEPIASSPSKKSKKKVSSDPKELQVLPLILDSEAHSSRPSRSSAQASRVLSLVSFEDDEDSESKDSFDGRNRKKSPHKLSKPNFSKSHATVSKLDLHHSPKSSECKTKDPVKVPSLKIKLLETVPKTSTCIKNLIKDDLQPIQQSLLKKSSKVCLSPQNAEVSSSVQEDISASKLLSKNVESCADSTSNDGNSSCSDSNEEEISEPLSSPKNLAKKLQKLSRSEKDVNSKLESLENKAKFSLSRITNDNKTIENRKISISQKAATVADWKAGRRVTKTKVISAVAKADKTSMKNSPVPNDSVETSLNIENKIRKDLINLRLKDSSAKDLSFSPNVVHNVVDTMKSDETTRRSSRHAKPAPLPKSVEFSSKKKPLIRPATKTPIPTFLRAKRSTLSPSFISGKPAKSNPIDNPDFFESLKQQIELPLHVENFSPMNKSEVSSTSEISEGSKAESDLKSMPSILHSLPRGTPILDAHMVVEGHLTHPIRDSIDLSLSESVEEQSTKHRDTSPSKYGCISPLSLENSPHGLKSPKKSGYMIENLIETTARSMSPSSDPIPLTNILSHKDNDTSVLKKDVSSSSTSLKPHSNDPSQNLCITKSEAEGTCEDIVPQSCSVAGDNNPTVLTEKSLAFQKSKENSLLDFKDILKEAALAADIDEEDFDEIPSKNLKQSEKVTDLSITIKKNDSKVDNEPELCKKSSATFDEDNSDELIMHTGTIKLSPKDVDHSLVSYPDISSGRDYAKEKCDIKSPSEIKPPTSDQLTIIKEKSDSLKSEKQDNVDLTKNVLTKVSSGIVKHKEHEHEIISENTIKSEKLVTPSKSQQVAKAEDLSLLDCREEKNPSLLLTDDSKDKSIRDLQCGSIEENIFDKKNLVLPLKTTLKASDPFTTVTDLPKREIIVPTENLLPLENKNDKSIPKSKVKSILEKPIMGKKSEPVIENECQSNVDTVWNAQVNESSTSLKGLTVASKLENIFNTKETASTNIAPRSGKISFSFKDQSRKISSKELPFENSSADQKITTSKDRKDIADQTATSESANQSDKNCDNSTLQEHPVDTPLNNANQQSALTFDLSSIPLPPQLPLCQLDVKEQKLPVDELVSIVSDNSNSDSRGTQMARRRKSEAASAVTPKKDDSNGTVHEGAATRMSTRARSRGRSIEKEEEPESGRRGMKTRRSKKEFDSVENNGNKLLSPLKEVVENPKKESDLEESKTDFQIEPMVVPDPSEIPIPVVLEPKKLDDEKSQDDSAEVITPKKLDKSENEDNANDAEKVETVSEGDSVPLVDMKADVKATDVDNISSVPLPNQSLPTNISEEDLSQANSQSVVAVDSLKPESVVQSPEKVPVEVSKAVDTPKPVQIPEQKSSKSNDSHRRRRSSSGSSASPSRKRGRSRSSSERSSSRRRRRSSPAKSSSRRKSPSRRTSRSSRDYSSRSSRRSYRDDRRRRSRSSDRKKSSTRRSEDNRKDEKETRNKDSKRNRSADTQENKVAVASGKDKPVKESPSKSSISNISKRDSIEPQLEDKKEDEKNEKTQANQEEKAVEGDLENDKQEQPEETSKDNRSISPDLITEDAETKLDFEVPDAKDDEKPPEEIKPESPFKSARKVSLHRSKSGGEDEKERPKRKKWGSSSTASKTSLEISSESLKSIIPDVKPLSPSELTLQFEASESEEEEEEKVTSPKEEKPSCEIEVEEKPKRIVREISPIAKKPRTDSQSSRKIRLTETGPAIASSKPAIAPARHPTSNVIYLQNLVRPFTIKQLRDLLQRTGRLAIDKGFWIDPIKSKCIAKFDNVDQAEETRMALHGVKWPNTNPKYLHVDFSTEEELEKRLAEAANPALRMQPVDEARRDRRKIDRPAVREWDLAKMGERSPGEKEREKERQRREREEERIREREKRNRDRSPRDEKDRKHKKDVIIKSLDELFKKTMAQPSIYWLPLTPEQIIEKEALRRKRMADSDRMMAEMKKEQEKRRLERIARQEERQKRRERSKSRRRSRSRRRSPRRSRRSVSRDSRKSHRRSRSRSRSRS